MCLAFTKSHPFHNYVLLNHTANVALSGSFCDNLTKFSSHTANGAVNNLIFLKILLNNAAAGVKDVRYFHNQPALMKMFSKI